MKTRKLLLLLALAAATTGMQAQRIKGSDTVLPIAQQTAERFMTLNPVSYTHLIAFIGPSGCGKSTFLRLLNRMNDLIPDTRLTGEIRIDGQDIYGKGVQVDELRKNVGMVFQRPNPFPKSIFENVAYGLRVNGITDNAFIRQRVEETLKGAALWDEVKDKLKVSAYALSGGQQQRLCIARAMAVSPSVLLMDEPASALDRCV